MKPEDKKLLLKDLCARLPYWVKVKVRYFYVYEDGTFKKYNEIKYLDAETLDLLINGDRSLDDIKPYLHPISSMTEEEHNEWFNYYHEIELKEAKSTGDYLKAAILGESTSIDWLNKNRFDFRGLIDKGLAIEVTEDNNPYED